MASADNPNPSKPVEDEQEADEASTVVFKRKKSSSAARASLKKQRTELADAEEDEKAHRLGVVHSACLLACLDPQCLIHDVYVHVYV